MSLQVSPLFSPQMPVELRLVFFSYLTLPELCKTGRVCKEWFELTKADLLWKPFLREPNSLADKSVTNESSATLKTTAVAEFQNSLQKKVDLIISLIDDDSQLASIIGNSDMSLIELKAMLPFKRTLLVMRGLKKDCTGLLVHLPKKHIEDLKNYVHQDLLRTTSGNTRGLMAFSIDNFYQNNQCLPLLLELVKAPPGPFNASRTVSATMALLDSPPAMVSLMHVIGSIVESHRDLTEFFKTKVMINITPEVPPKIVEATEFTHRVLIPQMHHYAPDAPKVTIEDWKKCGYTQETSKVGI